MAEDNDIGFHWASVSMGDDTRIDFTGKNLQGGKFAGEDFKGAIFSVADLRDTDFSKANLSGVDFSGANLSGANLSDSNLENAILNSTQLVGTNFTGANLKGARFTDADITDAILLDVVLDNISIEELQNLIEYLAVYYPHKLNLTRINLTLFQLAKIDLRNVSLRGVDFTGCDFTGVNILELDLSECIITPQQIAQALGRVPSAEELKKILAPKPKKKLRGGIDFTDLFFDNGKRFGTLDAMKHKGIEVATLMKVGQKALNAVGIGGKKKEKKIPEKTELKSSNEELRKVIEDRKKIELEKMKYRKERALQIAKAKEQEQNKVPGKNRVNKVRPQRVGDSR